MHPTRRLLVAVSVPLVALVVGGTLRARVQSATDDTLRELKVFSEALGLVGSKYVEEVDLRQLERGSFQGVVESLDPWSSYHDPERMEPLLARDRSGDVGLLLFKQAQQYVRIAVVVPGSPADAARIRPLEHVETIDGLATKDLTLLEARAMLAGPPGSTVKLGFFRTTDEGEGRTVELTRRGGGDLRVHGEPRPDGIMVLRVTDLEPGVAALARAKLRELSGDSTAGVVLDLRNAAGGVPEEAVALASLFVDAGPAFRLKSRSGLRDLPVPAGRAWAGRTAVLIGRSTVGEAELVALALRERAAAPLVGRPTFGKFTRQEFIRLPDGSGLLLSSGRYERATGEPLPEAGVLPDAPEGTPAPGAAAQPGAPDGPDPKVPPGQVAPDLRAPAADADDEAEPDAEERTGGVLPSPDADQDLEKAIGLLKAAPAPRAAG